MGFQLTDDQDYYDNVLRVLKKPGYEATLRTILEAEGENDGKGPVWPGYLDRSPTGTGWRCDEAGVPAQKVGHLRTTGIVTCFVQTRTTKIYCIANADIVRRALAAHEREQELTQAVAEQEEQEINVDNLFSWIVGYEKIKKWSRRALTAKKPVHIAYIGPPATAKSAFLFELARVPGARFFSGSGKISKSGLWEVLATNPPVLCVDELEKMSATDVHLLHTLMAEGYIQVDQHENHQRIYVDTRVFGSANEWAKVADAIKSRMKDWHFEAYTPEEFVLIAKNLLMTVEGVEEDLAGYIAEVTGRFTRDIREAIRYGRLCVDREDVDDLYDTDMEWSA